MLLILVNGVGQIKIPKPFYFWPYVLSKTAEGWSCRTRDYCCVTFSMTMKVKTKFLCMYRLVARGKKKSICMLTNQYKIAYISYPCSKVGWWIRSHHDTIELHLGEVLPNILFNFKNPESCENMLLHHLLIWNHLKRERENWFFFPITFDLLFTMMTFKKWDICMRSSAHVLQRQPTFFKGRTNFGSKWFATIGCTWDAP